MNKKGQKPKGSNDIEIVQITVRDIVDYCLSTDWFHGKKSSVPETTEEQSDTTENDISSLNNKDYILYHCCEELELLSREFNNDEGGRRIRCGRS